MPNTTKMYPLRIKPVNYRRHSARQGQAHGSRYSLISPHTLDNLFVPTVVNRTSQGELRPLIKPTHSAGEGNHDDFLRAS